jgi:hypothetical protein
VMPVSEPGGSRIRSPIPEPDPTVWGQDMKWILQFDNVIKHPGGKCKGCHCDVHDRARGLESGTKFTGIVFVGSNVRWPFKGPCLGSGGPHRHEQNHRRTSWPSG